MSNKRHSAEEIVNKLLQADVEIGRGKPVGEACRLLGDPQQLAHRRDRRALAELDLRLTKLVDDLIGGMAVPRHDDCPSWSTPRLTLKLDRVEGAGQHHASRPVPAR